MTTPPTPTNDLRLLGLLVENVKRVKLVHIRPRTRAGVVEIAGKNNQGKSSTLDSFEYLIVGQKAMPARPLRTGTTKGRIVGELADQTGKIVLRVTRSLVPTDSTITVERVDGGGKISRPQDFLNILAGVGFGFDPLAFSRMKPKDQVEQLLGLVKLEEDPRALDATRQKHFEDRTAVNRDVKRLEAQLAGMPAVEEGVPDEEISVALLAAEQARRAAACRENDAVRAAVAEAVSDQEDAARLVKGLEAQLAEITRHLNEARAAHTRAGVLVAEAQERAGALVDPDVDAITTQIGTAEQTNAKVRTKLSRREATEQLLAKSTEAEILTRKIAAVADRKTELLAKATFPIPGLDFELVGNDYVVTFNGEPLEQSSQSDQIKVGFEIAAAVNPSIHVVLIRDGSLLDADSRAAVDALATEKGYHVLMEVVGDGDPGAFIIEDGGVRDVEPAAKAATVAW